MYSTQIFSNLAAYYCEGMSVGEGTDCNLMRFGIYLGFNLSNAPTDAWYMIISADIEHAAVQVAFALYGTDIYKRSKAGGIWNEWTKINNLSP